MINKQIILIQREDEQLEIGVLRTMSIGNQLQLQES